MTKIKICGLFREEDIEYVNAVLPDYAGFIIDYPESRRNISAEYASCLIKKLKPEIKSVGVFVDRPYDAVADIAADTGIDVIQLHGHEDNGYIESLRNKVKLPVWKAFKVRGSADLEDALKSLADMVLLDNGYGTGRTFDWKLIKDFKREFILAGGLNTDNIAGAVRMFSPYVIDISSGVETDGRKDIDKIRAAVEAVHSA